MKTGVQTSMIINTRKIKKKPLKANCKYCVNNIRNGCRFGWELINGKCTRYGVNQAIPKAEQNVVKEHNKVVNEDKKNIRKTTVANISKVLGCNLTMEDILSCKNSRMFGNCKFAIRTSSEKNRTIEVIYTDRILKFEIVEI